ncbi:hypothetical protein [Methanobacterium alcaliphilum]|uniref:hypothetical protein n=1 Tax=Methanobacterium alcaliphilum TaxID=392018 RepID=UPI00200B97A1|nr:hypothetical protein [Methanobacterium alcaliphilum]MCK9150516.1 hypothetical protein [Methanobacterium alcaliphilum]
MNLIQITRSIGEGQNLLFYDRDVQKVYLELNSKYNCIFFNEPVPLKVRVIECIETVVRKKEASLKKFTTAELIKILLAKLNSNKLIILFNGFHLLNRQAVSSLQELNNHTNIMFICSFNKEFKSEVYGFYKTFQLVNMEEYRLETGQDEINITYPVYFIFGVIAFLIFLKASSLANVSATILGALWFGLIIFRTMVYVGGRP